MFCLCIQDVIEDLDLSSSSDEEPNAEPPEHVHRLILQLLIIWQFTFRISSAGITAFLHLFKWLLLYLGRSFQCEQLQKMSNQVPLTLSTVHRILSYRNCKNDFVQYVVCPSCDSLYEYDDCVETSISGHRKSSKHCRHVSYPNHHIASKRSPCGALLLKKIKSKNGYKLVPIKVYPYKPLRISIEQLVSKKGFVENCERWRNRVVPAGFLSDIYEGAVWKKFYSPEMNNFLCLPHHYLLTLNVDWFQPFEHGIYSVGAIYLTVQNLPRNERYKTENIILVGIIPGPKEPHKTINSYLQPLVHELNHSWLHGMEVTTSHNSQICVKVALSCVTCDIPATRKVCGFLSHHATKGCNKCSKEFPVRDNRTYYYGFSNTEAWTARTREQHIADIEEISKEVTKTKIKEAESKYGCRYSILLDIPYFNPIEFCAIDSMHNLYLGTAKHVFEVWVDKKVLTKRNLVELERRIKLFNVPCDVGRVPSHMSSYKSFTANQWKNWIILYSCVLLKDMLSSTDYRCWKFFVHSCVIINSCYLRESDIRSVHLFLQQFCLQFETLYGRETCTFNMHLHMHLAKTLLDFGPAHASWCYAFERFNGLLGSYSTNNKAIEPQIMRRFIEHQAIFSEEVPYAEFQSMLPHNQQQESRSKTITNSFSLLHYSADPLNTIDTFAWTKEMEAVCPLPPFCEEIFSALQVRQLSDIYQQLYSSSDVDITAVPLSVTHYKFGRLLLAGDLIGSQMPGQNNKSSSVIMAYWPSRVQDLASAECSTMQVGVVQYFMQHKFHYHLSDRIQEDVHLFACVKWKRLHTYLL